MISHYNVPIPTKIEAISLVANLCCQDTEKALGQAHWLQQLIHDVPLSPLVYLVHKPHLTFIIICKKAKQ